MITILVADNHDGVRLGVCSVLESERGFCVIGEVVQGSDVLQHVAELGPDVLLIDWTMPGQSGLDVARQIRERGLRTRVVIYSFNRDESYALEARNNGVMGYVLKQAEAVHLITAIREAAAGRHYLSPPLAEEKLEEYRQRSASERGKAGSPSQGKNGSN